MEKLKLIKRENEISKILLNINKNEKLKEISIEYSRLLNEELKNINEMLLKILKS